MTNTKYRDILLKNLIVELKKRKEEIINKNENEDIIRILNNTIKEIKKLSP